MTKRSVILGVTAALAASAAFGCAGTPTQGPAAMQAAERHVASVSDKAAVKAFFAQVPQQLTDAQAQTMLTTIDPSKVVTDTNASVAWAPGGLGLYGLGRRGFYGGFGGFMPNYANFRYLTIGTTLVPYSHAGGFWTPYSTNGWYNLFDLALGMYYPFNINANWCCQ